jgi:hypothetical protein
LQQPFFLAKDLRCFTKTGLSFSKIYLGLCSVVVTAGVGSTAVAAAAATSLWAPDVALSRLLVGVVSVDLKLPTLFDCSIWWWGAQLQQLQQL